MTRLITISALFALATGCIFYEEPDRKGDDDKDPGIEPPTIRDPGDDRDPNTDPPDPSRDTMTGDTDATDQPPVVPSPFTFDPSVLTPGTNTIIVVTSNGTVDLTAVSSLEFFGDAGLTALATRARSSTEFLLALAVPADAEEGPQDVLVRFTDGTGVWVEDALDVSFE